MDLDEVHIDKQEAGEPRAVVLGVSTVLRLQHRLCLPGYHHPSSPDGLRLQTLLQHLPAAQYDGTFSGMQDLTPKLVIYDPINPVNNVGRTTYRISTLKNLFRVIYIRLKGDSLKIGDILHPDFLDVIQEAH